MNASPSRWFPLLPETKGETNEAAEEEISSSPFWPAGYETSGSAEGWTEWALFKVSVSVKTFCEGYSSVSL